MLNIPRIHFHFIFAIVSKILHFCRSFLITTQNFCNFPHKNGVSYCADTCNPKRERCKHKRIFQIRMALFFVDLACGTSIWEELQVNAKDRMKYTFRLIDVRSQTHCYVHFVNICQVSKELLIS